MQARVALVCSGRIEVFGKHTDYAGGRSCWRRCRGLAVVGRRAATIACG